MKIEKIEVKSIREEYVAFDGTKFGDKDQCIAFEQSAYGMLKFRLVQMAVTQTDECSLFKGAGSDENQAFVVIPKTDDEVKTLQQLVYMKAYGDEYRKKFAEKCAVGKPLVVGISYEDDGLWIVDLDELVRDATGGLFGAAPIARAE